MNEYEAVIGLLEEALQKVGYPDSVIDGLTVSGKIDFLVRRVDVLRADLARITAERDAAMKLLARADVAFRCDLSQPEANDYYLQTREDIAAALKQSS